MSMDDAPPGPGGFTAAMGCMLAAALIPAADAVAQWHSAAPAADVTVSEPWVAKRVESDKVKLYLRRKRTRKTSGPAAQRGTILFVHGSSVSATPVFDLQIAGRPGTSTMDWFARAGFDTWCVDCEGYGYSDKWRPVNA